MSDQELNNKTPELLYHYCSVETFFQIIKYQTLRLTNIKYMNDSEELHYGLDLLGEVDSNFKSDKESRDNHDIYAMCFSEEGDLLSQWRGYGDNTEGVSIGFDFSMLKEEKDLNIPRDSKSNAHYIHSLQQVIYNPEEQEKKVSEFLNIDKKDTSLLEEQGNKLVSSLKNPYFNEEKEWRLISTINSYLNTPHKNESLSFYVTNKNIVPYIDRNFEDIFNISKKGFIPRASGTKFPTDEDLDNYQKNLYPIKHIIIGSSCKLDRITITKFLFHYYRHHNKNCKDSPQIMITKSNLSYKAK